MRYVKHKAKKTCCLWEDPGQAKHFVSHFGNTRKLFSLHHRQPSAPPSILIMDQSNDGALRGRRKFFVPYPSRPQLARGWGCSLFLNPRTRWIEKEDVRLPPPRSETPGLLAAVLRTGLCPCCWQLATGNRQLATIFVSCDLNCEETMSDNTQQNRPFFGTKP